MTFIESTISKIDIKRLLLVTLFQQELFPGRHLEDENIYQNLSIDIIIHRKKYNNLTSTNFLVKWFLSNLYLSHNLLHSRLLVYNNTIYWSNISNKLYKLYGQSPNFGQSTLLTTVLSKNLRLLTHSIMLFRPLVNLN